MCDECTWHHKTFLAKLYLTLGNTVVLYCIAFDSLWVSFPSCLPTLADVTSLFPVSAAVTNQSAGAP